MSLFIIVLIAITTWPIAKFVVGWHEHYLYNRFLDAYKKRLNSQTLTRQEMREFMAGGGKYENWRQHARRWEYK